MCQLLTKPLNIFSDKPQKSPQLADNHMHLAMSSFPLSLSSLCIFRKARSIELQGPMQTMGDIVGLRSVMLAALG